MRILVTNDDGIRSPGLLALAQTAIAAGHDVVVAAPAEEHSGASASIIATEGSAVTAAGARGRIRVDTWAFEGLEVPAYAVHAAPALIVLLGAHGSFGAAPDLVLSGINHGANVGRAVLHSGTVGAALTAGMNGARGLAVSLAVGLEPGPVAYWDAAAEAAGRVLPVIAAAPAGTVVNLNVPNDPAAAPIVEAPLAPFGIVQGTITERDDTHVVLDIAQHAPDAVPGTDAALLAAGSATVTGLSAVGDVPLPR